MNQSTIDKINKELFNFVEDCQEKIVQVGGRFFRQSEIEKMTINEFYNLFYPNGIKLIVVNYENNLT